MQNKTTDELVRIALVGGGMEIDASRRTIDDLVRIALVTGSKGAQLRITGASTKTTDDLVRLALAGKGSVFFVG